MMVGQLEFQAIFWGEKHDLEKMMFNWSGGGGGIDGSCFEDLMNRSSQ